MFRHVVLFTWTPEATEQQKKALERALGELPAQIRSIRDYRFGPDAGLNPANTDFAVVADFDDARGYLAYRDDPAHREVVERYVSPILAGRASLQYEC
jgi:stress responsive alpha/beta barrel protein